MVFAKSLLSDVMLLLPTAERQHKLHHSDPKPRASASCNKKVLISGINEMKLQHNYQMGSLSVHAQGGSGHGIT